MHFVGKKVGSCQAFSSTVDIPNSVMSLCKKRIEDLITKGSPFGDTLSLSCEASVGTSGSNN